MVPEERHLQFHRKDGICVGMQVSPLGHLLQEAVQRRLIDVMVLQEIDAGTELLPESGLDAVEVLFHG